MVLGLLSSQKFLPWAGGPRAVVSILHIVVGTWVIVVANSPVGATYHIIIPHVDGIDGHIPYIACKCYRSNSKLHQGFVGITGKVYLVQVPLSPLSDM